MKEELCKYKKREKRKILSQFDKQATLGGGGGEE
jgi:hypothetical protein